MIKKAIFLLLKIDPQTLRKIGSTSVIQIWFHKRYSKLVSQKLVKIGFTSSTKLKNLPACNFFYQIRY